VKALREAGEVDFLHVRRPSALRRQTRQPDGIGLRRVAHTPVDAVGRDARPAPGSCAAPAGLPIEATAIWNAAAPAAADFAGRLSYDVAWYCPETAWFAAGGADLAIPAVVDIDNLYEVLLERWRAAGGPEEEAAGEDGATDPIVAWRRCHEFVAERARYVTVCSELDRRRLGARNVAVVPNGYREIPPRARTAAGERPTIIYQGSFAYWPNEDAARLLAEVLLPLVRERVRDATVALIGHGAERLDDLRSLRGVEVAGDVADMAAYLERSHVCAVPLRVGGGTRIKILEAFAHGVPVVSSSIGAEGIALRDGVHGYIADDPATFAARAADLLADAGLRRAIASSARALLLGCYSWESIKRRIVDVARAAASGEPGAGAVALGRWPG